MRFRFALLALPALLAACAGNRVSYVPPTPQPIAPVLTVTQARATMSAQEKAAFDLTALKSQLMVVSLTCRNDNHYNDFVRRFQRELGNADRTVGTWFNRTYGASNGRKQHDDFITTLANAQSQEGIRQGRVFCDNMTPFTGEVARLNTIGSATTYAANQQLGQPVMRTEVAAAPARATTAARPAARPAARTAARTQPRTTR